MGVVDAASAALPSVTLGGHYALLILLSLYGAHRLYHLLVWRGVFHEEQQVSDDWKGEKWPMVTVQLPVFNEKFVVARLLDAHFAVEQMIRSRSGAFFNFNGTGGVWRRSAIEDAGGWQADTLTEDMDLSYRAQMRGWRFTYRGDIECPSELPSDIATFKTQQRHWAKGAVQVSPLLLLETGVGAHLDAILVLGLTLILYAYAKEKWSLLGFALGWSACVKFLPLALLAPLLIAVPFRQFLKLVASCFAVIAFFYAGALSLGYTPIGILPTFFEKWRFTSPFYELLEYALRPGQVNFALGALAVIGVVIAGLVARHSLFAGFAVVLSVPLILSPVVFPWYLMILVPILALQPNTTLLAWVNAVPLSYVVLNQSIAYRVWEPAQWPVMVIGCILLASVAWDLAQRLSSSWRESPDVFPHSTSVKM